MNRINTEIDKGWGLKGKTIEQATKHIWRGQWLDNFYALEKMSVLR